MFTEEDKTIRKSGRINLTLEAVLEMLLVWGGFTTDDNREIGVLFEKGDSGVNEKIDTFLVADTTKDPDAVFSGKPERLPELGAVVRWGVGAKIDAVGDDDVRAPLDVGGGGATGADDGIRLTDEITSNPAVLALGGGGEGDTDFGPEELFEQKGLDDFVVAAGMKNAAPSVGEGFLAESDKLTKSRCLDVLGEVVVSEHGDLHQILLVPENLQHRRGHARKPGV